MPKVLQSSFGISAADASFYFGAALVPGAVGGILFGGWFVKWRKLNSKQTVRFAFYIGTCLSGSVFFLDLWRQ
jgi:hypothetical protein